MVFVMKDAAQLLQNKIQAGCPGNGLSLKICSGGAAFELD